LVGTFAGHRGLLLRNTCAVEFVLIAIAFVVVLPSAELPGPGVRIVVAALSAAALGIQNTTARRLAVPDLTTTVLTMTLTGIAADVRRSPAATVTRRVLAVLTMLLGAVLGTLLVLHVRVAAGLGLALLLLGVVVVLADVASRQAAPWHTHTA
jgi:uncharacterized membrane protein YoaK (UPF0700 family)